MGNLNLQRLLTLLSWFCFADGRVSVAYLESVPYPPSVSAPLARKINGICTNFKPNWNPDCTVNILFFWLLLTGTKWPNMERVAVSGRAKLKQRDNLWGKAIVSENGIVSDRGHLGKKKMKRKWSHLNGCSDFVASSFRMCKTCSLFSIETSPHFRRCGVKGQLLLSWVSP